MDFSPLILRALTLVHWIILSRVISLNNIRAARLRLGRRGADPLWLTLSAVRASVSSFLLLLRQLVRPVKSSGLDGNPDDWTIEEVGKNFLSFSFCGTSLLQLDWLGPLEERGQTTLTSEIGFPIGRRNCKSFPYFLSELSRKPVKKSNPPSSLGSTKEPAIATFYAGQ